LLKFIISFFMLITKEKVQQILDILEIMWVT